MSKPIGFKIYTSNILKSVAKAIALDVANMTIRDDRGGSGSWVIYLPELPETVANKIAGRGNTGDVQPLLNHDY